MSFGFGFIILCLYREIYTLLISIRILTSKNISILLSNKHYVKNKNHFICSFASSETGFFRNYAQICHTHKFSVLTDVPVDLDLANWSKPPGHRRSLAQRQRCHITHGDGAEAPQQRNPIPNPTMNASITLILLHFMK